MEKMIVNLLTGVVSQEEYTEQELLDITANMPTAEQLAEIEAAQAQQVQDMADTQEAKADVRLAAIAAMTPAQAAQWIDDNVSNLAEAKTALKVMAKAICVLARKL